MDQKDSRHTAGETDRARAAPGVSSQASANGFDLSAELSAARREIGELRRALEAAARRERTLVRELQHRVRNMLAVIRSVYRRTLESGASQDEFAEHFIGRLDALARYQSFVDDLGRSGVEIEDIVRSELLEGHCLDSPKCTINGPPVYLRQKSAELLSLAIHELTTNSIKFGALAQGGTIAVDWSVHQNSEDRWLRFRWVETGVSVTRSAPRPSGFGRQMIEEALPYQLGAKTSFELKPGGIKCSIQLPLPKEKADAEGLHGMPANMQASYDAED